jgi:hypothetical protein
MRAISKWAIAVFANPIGIVVLAALDSTLFFSLPFGIDAVVIILAARLRELWWIVPLLASLGSVAGAALTFWMGMKIGEKGLDRWVTGERRLDRIRRQIRENTSPHHVPRRIVQVADIPRTISGKITELAVREVIHGRPVKNVDALANPEALELYRDLEELRT